MRNVSRNLFSRPLPWLSVAALALLAPLASAQFTVTPVSVPATDVGTSSATQNLMLTATRSITINSVTVATGLMGKQEFGAGAITGCSSNGTTNTPSGSVCTVPITFSPAYPGLRSAPLTIVTSGGTFTYGLSGVGRAPLALLTPGIISTYVEKNGIAKVEGIAIDSAGNLYLPDFDSNVVRKVDAITGAVTTVAGSGNAGYGGDNGLAVNASLLSPHGVAVDSARNLYIADYNHVVRRVDASTGIITTFAGNGTAGYTGDGGPATGAELSNPQAMAFDSAGNLYIADFSINVVRRVSAKDGTIDTVAGNGNQGFSGDGGLATSAQLSTPLGLAIDSSGNIFIADNNNKRVREVTASTGIITTFAGNGSCCTSGDLGLATSAQLTPLGLAIDSANNLYIADGNVVRRVDSGTGGIFTIAGIISTGSAGYTGDGGPATRARLAGPAGVAVDGAGNIYLTDSGNVAVRKVSASAAEVLFPAPTIVGSADTADNPQLLMFSNIGNTTLQGAGSYPKISAGWTLDPTKSCNQFTVSVGFTCGFNLDFQPTASGTNTGTFTEQSNSLNAAASIQTATLLGTGFGAGTLTPDAIKKYFPDIPVGHGSASLSFTITNTGNGPVHATTVMLSDTVNFSKTDTCTNATLAVSATCAVNLTFTPVGNVQTDMLTVTLASDASNASLAFFAYGFSDPSNAPVVQGSPSSLSFSNTRTTVSPAQTFAIKNTGNGPLSIGPVYVHTAQSQVLASDSPSDAVYVTSNCPSGGTLAAGGTCEATVTYNVTYDFDGSATHDTLYLSAQTDGFSNGSQGTLTGAVLYVSFSGFAIPTFSPAAGVSFSTTAGTAAGNQTVYFGSTGALDLTLSSIAFTGRDAAAFTIVKSTCGTVFVANTTNGCYVTVGFPANAAGTYNAALTFTGDGFPASVSAPLTATVTGGAPSATLSPGALSFTTVAGTPSATQTVTLTNSGSGALAITSAVLAGTDASTFVLSTTCGSTLAINASCTYTVGFSSSAVGSFAATLVITDNSGSTGTTTTTQSVTIAGTATGAAKAVLTPLSAAFGTVALGGSLTQSLTLSNPGTAALAVSSTSIASSTFAVTSNTCGATLATAASCTIAVTFRPTDITAQSATLTVVDGAGTQTSALSGTGMGPIVALPATLSFGSVQIGSTASQALSLVNTGNAPLSLVQIAFGGANPGAFSQNNNCGATLAAGATCTITVTLNTAFTGTYTASLTVTDSASPAVQTTALSGTVVGVPQAVLTPTTLSFGTQYVGTSASQTLTLSNPGSAALTLTSFTSSQASFTASGGTCGTTLAAGGSCTRTITFAPTAAGAVSATLTVLDSAGTQTAALAGTGTVSAPALPTFSPTSLDFGSAALGSTSATQTVTLTNTGQAVLNLSSVAVTGANANEFPLTLNACGGSLATGASCTLSVVFAPSANGPATASLTVIDSVGTQTVPLTGLALSDFVITATPNPCILNRESGKATCIVTVSSVNPGQPFAGSVMLSAFAAQLNPGSTYTFTPPSLAPGATALTSTLVIQEAKLSASLAPRDGRSPGSSPGRSVAVSLAGCLGLLLWRRKKLSGLGLSLAIALTLLPASLMLSGCAFPIAAGGVALKITGANGSVSHSVQINLSN